MNDWGFRLEDISSPVHVWHGDDGRKLPVSNGIRIAEASFVLWFGAMTIHVLGHGLETPALAIADWRRAARRRVPGATGRLVLLGVTFALGIVLGVASLPWAHHWHG